LKIPLAAKSPAGRHIKKAPGKNPGLKKRIA